MTGKHQVVNVALEPAPVDNLASKINASLATLVWLTEKPAYVRPETRTSTRRKANFWKWGAVFVLHQILSPPLGYFYVIVRGVIVMTHRRVMTWAPFTFICGVD